MVERRTIADPKWVSRFIGKQVGGWGGGTFPSMLPPRPPPIDAHEPSTRLCTANNRSLTTKM